ncbi:hypothetical protein FJ656_11995, partial [Schumannella luteola]
MTDELTDRFRQPASDPFPEEFGSSQPVPPIRPRRRRRHVGRWVGGALVALLVAGFVAAAPWDAGRRQAYADQWIVWTDPPSARA